MDSRLVGVRLACCLGLIAQPSRAESQLPGAVLAVQNATSSADCVDEAVLGARIRAQLNQGQGALPGPTAPELRLEVVVRQTWTGLVAELRMSGRAAGNRQIEASRCQGLLEALAVTVAMILDQDASGSLETTEVASGASQPSTGSNGAAAWIQSNESRQKAKRARVRVASGVVETATVDEPKTKGILLGSGTELRAWIGGGVGTTPTWDLETGVALYLHDWGMHLGAYWQPTETTRLGPGQVQVMTVGGTSAGCWRSGREWRGVVCLRGRLGGKRVQGKAFDGAEPARILPVVHVGPSLGLETGSRWVFGLDLVGQVAMWRDSYALENSKETLESPRLEAWLVARVALSSRQ